MALKKIFCLLIFLFTAGCLVSSLQVKKIEDVKEEAIEAIINDKQLEANNSTIENKEIIEPTVNEDNIKNENKDNIKDNTQVAAVHDKNENDASNLEISSSNIEIITDDPSENILKIGLLVPLSGPAKEIGLSIYNAAELAIFETGSKKLRLFLRDTGDNVEIAIEAAKELEQEGVEIIIGPLFSAQAKQIREHLDGSIPIFSFTNDESIANKGIWTFGFSPQQQIKAILNEIKNKDINNIAVVVPNTAYGTVALETLKEAEIDKTITVKKIFKYLPDYNDLSNLNKSSSLARNIDYSGILIISSGQQLREISSRLQYIGVDPRKVKFFGLSGWNSTGIFGEPSLYGGVFVALDHRTYESFVSRYYNIYGDWPTEVSALGYDLVALCSYLYAESKKKSEIVNFAINSVGYNGLFGYFRIGQHGKIYRKYVSFKVMERSFLRQRDILPE